jgi:hypothetical protein
VTAPDPRLDEIQARLDVHVKCTDCGKCRVSVTEEWCPECDYWACEGGLACADDPYPADVRYLLAELRKAREALARVDEVAARLNWEADNANEGAKYAAEVNQGASLMALESERFAYQKAEHLIRAAVAAANGDE